jgi:hypothetical protein
MELKEIEMKIEYKSGICLSNDTTLYLINSIEVRCEQRLRA